MGLLVAITASNYMPVGEQHMGSAHVCERRRRHVRLASQGPVDIPPYGAAAFRGALPRGLFLVQHFTPSSGIMNIISAHARLRGCGLFGAHDWSFGRDSCQQRQKTRWSIDTSA